MERRADERIRKRGLGRIAGKPAILVDISSHGVQMLVPAIPKFRMVDIHLRIGDHILDCHGEIVWVRKSIAAGQSHCLGIIVRDPQPDFLQLAAKN